MRFKDSFHPYAMTTILFWSLAYVFTRLALRYFSAFSLGFLRYLAAACALIVVAVFTGMKPPKVADIKWFALSGAAGFFLYIITFNLGCTTVTASTSSIIIATVPVITAVLARILYKERLNYLQWAATALEFVGVAVLTVLNGGFSVNLGLVWLLCAAVLLSIYNLVQRTLTKSYTALQTSAFSIFCGTILLTVFSPLSFGEVTKAPPIQILYILILGIFSSAIAYCAWAKAFAKAKQTSSVSNYMFITPLLTTILGYLIAGEKPERSVLLGGFIILLGLFLFLFSGRLIGLLNRIAKPKSSDT